MTIETACQIANGQLVGKKTPQGPFRGVSIDTRTLRPGNAFFCLRGARSDGHRFAREAARNGAAVIIAESDRAARWRNWTVPVMGVDDPLTVMGDLAAEFLRLFPTRFVAVTGSVGKTTTKEMIAAALSARFDVYKSPGNYNNLIGIPLALLRRNQHARTPERYGVLEFGMSSPGEIARLTEIVKPEWGVLTRIAPAHLLQMHSLAAIARAKRELFDHSAPTTVAFLNDDDPFQRRWHTRWQRPTVTYSVEHDADFVAGKIETTPRGTVAFTVNARHRFEVRLAGSHNVGNALAAVAVARHLGVPFTVIAAALRKVSPVGQRSRVTRLGELTLIEDCYNANPTSAIAALESLAAWPAKGRRIAVLGAMRELGPNEKDWHRRVGRVAGRLADVVVTVGDLARQYAEGMQRKGNSAQAIIARDRAAAARILARLLRPGDVVLFKASHSEQFEEMVAGVRERWRAVSEP